MDRLVNTSLEEFERLFEESVEWKDAVYPRGCRPGRGWLRTVLAPAGGLILHVAPCSFAAPSFRLSALFEAGTAIFPTPRDMFAFWHGELAKALGIEVTVDLPEPDAAAPAADGAAPPPVLQSALDVEPSVEPTGARRRARRIAALPGFSAESLAARLGEVVHGQPAALERVAHVVATQLAKRKPSRPGTVLLLGPTGSGKTSTIEALPDALAALGKPGTHVFRVDCNELSERIQLTRLLGAPPGYIGYDPENPLLDALAKPGCILLLDEVEKAHPNLIHDVVLNLLDTGRLTAPDGSTVEAAHAVIALTTNVAVDELQQRLHRVPLEHRWAVQEICRNVLLEEEFPPELVGRIGAFAVYRDLDDESLKAAATGSVTSLAREYGMSPTDIDPILADVLLDIAGRSGLGARALHHAASELLGSAFAAAAGGGLSGRVVIETGPPITVRDWRSV
ncbi:MAG: AAA family ATPase [Gaiellaceae bacterium]